MTGSNITIRAATSADAPGIAAILRETGWFEHINATPAEQTERLLAESLEHTDERSTLLVALDLKDRHSVIAGYIAAHWFPTLLRGHEGFISELFVHPSCTGRGVGSELLNAIKGEALERGCARLELVNMRFRESYQRGFYKKHGWEERLEAAQFVLFLPEKQTAQV